MPGKVKVKIVSGRNLPIMDRSNLTTDAYVEVKLGSTIYKTDVYRKSLNPIWNSEWFRFEMDDLELQDEPLQIRLMDHDTYSSNDAIGKVYLDLNPLLCNSSRGKDTSGKMISGWIPVYDTMHGIRGEVNLIVKVELFSDLNKFRQSSCGVRFFFTQSVPEGYIAHIMQGFVEELVVNDDPEYQWIDKIRTPRASNEARQTLFSKLSGEVQRRVGLKALELGGNAVIGYKQCFDLEGESGIVVRGIGTAAYLTKQYESQLSPTCGDSLGMSRESPIPEEFLMSDRATPTTANSMAQSSQNNSSLTGGVLPNFSISSTTNTNTAQQNKMVVANYSAQTMTVAPNNSLTTTTSTNINGSGGGGGVGDGSGKSPSKKLVSSEDNNECGGAGATSLTTTAPTPSHPTCDPQHYHCQANGCPVNHRLQHLHQQQGIKECYPSFSQDMSVDSESALDNGDGGGDNGVVLGNSCVPANKAVVKPTPKIGHQLSGKVGVSFPVTGTSSHAGITMDHNIPIHRRSSESDLSTPPKPTVTVAHMRNYPTTAALKGGIAATVDQYGLMEYPFITISQFPPGFLTHIGGTVTARSVKLLERISNLDEPESRDAWWNEIRMEIRAHCRAFGCTVVVGYEEQTTMCDDVCVLSASGTAAIAATTIGLKNVELLTVSTKQGTGNPKTGDAPCPGRGVEKDRALLSKVESLINAAANNGAIKHMLGSSKIRHDSDIDPSSSCTMFHIPSNPAVIPFPVKMSRCHVCRKGRVPDVLIVTVDIPPGLHITGKGTLIQAQVFRPKKDCKGETSAKEVSDSLPFLEYELHRRLINKLKVKGMNAVFGLKVQICLGDKLMVALATGTAMYVTALPPPGVPIITAGNMKTDAQKVLQYQKVVQDAYDRNRQLYELKNIFIPNNGRLSGSSGEESEDDDAPEIQANHKDTYLLEVDDAEDIDIISMLIDPHPSTAFFMNNIDYLHGYEEHHVTSQQMFTQVWRCRIPTLSLRQFTAYFERLIRSVCFKLRKMMPCVLTKLSFRVDIPEQDEMQIVISGLALGMADQSKIVQAEKFNAKSENNLPAAKEITDLMFPIEDDGTNHRDAKGTDSSSTGNESSKELQRGTPPPSGVLVSASGHIHTSPGGRQVAQTPCVISSSPHSQSSSQLSGNGAGQVNGSGTAAAPSPAVAPQSKLVSGDFAAVPNAGNLASNVNCVPSGHGPNYSFRGLSHSQHLASFSRSGSKLLYPMARQRYNVEITPLSYIPGAKIEKYLGNLNFFFIRETTSIRESGGLSGFVHNFVAEILAIVRAHINALGGNAMTSYFMTELALLHNPHKNQGQCLINIGGDVVSLMAHPLPLSEDAQYGS